MLRWLRNLWFKQEYTEPSKLSLLGTVGAKLQAFSDPTGLVVHLKIEGIWTIPVEQVVVDFVSDETTMLLCVNLTHKPYGDVTHTRLINKDNILLAENLILARCQRGDTLTITITLVLENK